ncbi:MAG: cellobiose phosphorylase [Candidatus Omnitrophica bacterium]|jgi:cellobiose phosphorylase|nr:cellobiose phosphorylase [Candidatus Omnitrophota bacterium]
MKNNLWQFNENNCGFSSFGAEGIKQLYFPLCNKLAFASSITPDLHGDAKIRNNCFLLEPVSRINLTSSRASRNFWAYIRPDKIWSATGVSKDLATTKKDKLKIEAGLLWHKASRENPAIGLKAAITSFVPIDQQVEIMLVEITNISRKNIAFTPTAAIPLYGRSADNLRDHRHVTSLLNRIEVNKYGVILKPTLAFDESGHKSNTLSYFVLGTDASGKPARHIYPSEEEFCGDASDLEAPMAVVKDLPSRKDFPSQGKEAMGALKFSRCSLKPKKSFSYIIVFGIAKRNKDISSIFKKFNSLNKVAFALKQNCAFWQKESAKIKIQTANADFDKWFSWVTIQPTLRKIYGCSFLPDFDYGKGGRGWRDLWQDCLSLSLTGGHATRGMLINNFKGVRVDGSNATIIGQKEAEFICDRNNISRTWMDHGAWPLLTTHFYIHQTQDIKILFQKIPYWRDRQLCRGKQIDLSWNNKETNTLKTKKHKTYYGTILEHILVQNLTQFFNTGIHNHIRLENADWNDGLDMASAKGESVCFTSMYAANLKSIVNMLEENKIKEIVIFKELKVLLDCLSGRSVDYGDSKKKNLLLKEYLDKTQRHLSGETIAIRTEDLIRDLNKKADFIFQNIRNNEWLKDGFFNGYYDNNSRRCEGKVNNVLRMSLTAQVFPVLSGLATKEQIKTLFNNSIKYLRDKKLKGWHLNTDFKRQMPELGRAFSFIYGEKENGAFFNHMTVMFSYALYKEGFDREAFEVLYCIYQMALNTEKSKIYPCLPEYFNAQGRGMYSYLTGSASWFVFTLVTQNFGVRGEYGDLLIAPKLALAQFNKDKKASIEITFADKRIRVVFVNTEDRDSKDYKIDSVKINGALINAQGGYPKVRIPRREFLKACNKTINTIEVTLR